MPMVTKLVKFQKTYERLQLLKLHELKLIAWLGAEFMEDFQTLKLPRIFFLNLCSIIAKNIDMST